MATPVVTFDAGQTLIDLDLDFLEARLVERGVRVAPAALAAATPAAWRRYDELVERGAGHPWKPFMAALLAGAGIDDDGELVEWLYVEQASKNLWRRPIVPMVALARELVARGVVVAVLSNSEGHLAELLAEIGLASSFAAIIDSGRIGIAKPDPEIFAHTLDQLGVSDAHAVHIGDSWSADVAGALAAGWRAIWYRSRSGTKSEEVAQALASGRVVEARDADEVRAALAKLGI
jgi:HAD superfamily hydrolase (TIGR01509 family)